MKKFLLPFLLTVFLVACTSATLTPTSATTPIPSPTTTPLPTPTAELEEVKIARLITEAKAALPAEGFETVLWVTEIEEFDELKIDSETNKIYTESDFWRIEYNEKTKKWEMNARAEVMDERLIEGIKKIYLEKHPEFGEWGDVTEKVLSYEGIKWHRQEQDDYWTGKNNVNFMQIFGLELGPAPVRVKGLDQENSYGLLDVLHIPNLDGIDDYKEDYGGAVVAYVVNGQVLPNSLPTPGESSNFAKSPNYYYKDFVVGQDNTVLLRNNFENFVLNRSAEDKLVFSALTIPLCGEVPMTRSDIGAGISVDWVARLDRSKAIDLLAESYFLDFTSQEKIFIDGEERLIKSISWRELAQVLEERGEVPIATRVHATY